MKSILIVDDAMFMRRSIRSILEKNGYQVAGEAENGRVSIAMCLKLKPDIVTMDITMPEMDGIQALKKIKEVAPQTLVVMISAMGQEDMVREAILSGASGFIVKPFDEKFVLETLNKL